MQRLEPASLEHLKSTSPIWHSLSTTVSYLIGDFFIASHYKESLQMAAAMLPLHRPSLQRVHEKRQATNAKVLERSIARAEETSRWALKMEDEGYHTMFSHVFMSLWAAQEAGVENLIAAMIRHNFRAAEIAATKLKPGKVESLDFWPWSEQVCRDAASSLERLAINKTKSGGVDAMGRIKTLFGWFDVTLVIPEDKADSFNEANGVRNLLLHQYGEVSAQDVQKYPGLAQFQGGRIAMSGDRLHCYHEAIVSLFQQLILNLHKSPCSGST